MISINEIPYREFEMLGLSKKDVLSFPPRTLNALLSGNRTSLIRFNYVSLGTSDNKLTLDGKLSLRKTFDGKVHLNFHPVNKTPKNAFDLTLKEVAHLEKNEANFVDKKIRGEDGKLKDVKICLDKLTNEYVAINRETIKAPEQINNTVLTEKQKEDFKEGKTIKVEEQEFKLNPNSEIGISSANGDDSNNISKMRFKHSSYSSNELLIDLALIASGLGAFVMLEHLANLFIHSERTKQQNLNDPRYWEAIHEASKEIKQLKEEMKFKPAVIEGIISKHLQELGIAHTVSKQDLEDSTVNKEKVGMHNDHKTALEKKTNNQIKM